MPGQRPNRHNWIYTYAKPEEIDDYLRLGWCPHDAKKMRWIENGRHAVIVEWICDCEPPLPIFFEEPPKRTNGTGRHG